jgi:hypothetical protein
MSLEPCRFANLFSCPPPPFDVGEIYQLSEEHGLPPSSGFNIMQLKQAERLVYFVSSGANSNAYLDGTGGSYPGAKRLQLEAYHSPESSAEDRLLNFWLACWPSPAQ